MDILVTGATGFIGQYVIRRLLNENQSVRIFARNPDKLDMSLLKSVNIYKGDLRDKNSVNRAINGCDKVIHLGAVATGWERNPRIYLDVNYNGTKNIFDACLKYKVYKVVYASTSLSPVQKKESAGKISNLPDYVKSKFFSEQLTDVYLEKGLDINIVYPTRVFGPGVLNDANSATKVIDMYLRNKFPFIINNGTNKANWVYVDDVAQGIIKTLYKGGTGKRYILGGENIDDNYLFNLLDEISGKKHLRINLMYSAAAVIASAFDITSAIIPYKPLITSKWLRALSENNTASVENSVIELGYSVTPIAEALTLTVDWLMKKNYFDHSLSVSTNL